MIARIEKHFRDNSGCKQCFLSCQQLLRVQHNPHSIKRRVYTCAGFYGYSGEGFSLLLPSQWNPSKEREEPGVVLRYEDNGDSVNHVVVISRKADKGSIEGYGSPEEFLNKISSLLGKQVFVGGRHPLQCPLCAASLIRSPRPSICGCSLHGTNMIFL